jgi:hypothetical protein
LARDRNPQIRAAVARNPSVSWLLVGHLARDGEAAVRAAAQQRMAFSPDRLAYLAGDPNPARRRAVATHPQTASGTLERLCADADAGVRAAVARHPRTSPAMLARLARDGEPAVRAAVAEHPRLAPHVRRQLELDLDRTVRAHVAQNPQAPFLTVKRLWAPAAGEQLRLLARHPAVTPVRRGQLYARLFAAHLRHLKSAPSLVRLAALASAILPAEVYEVGGASPQWLDRYVVASNPAAPLPVVRALSRDGIVYVRAAARANLAAHGSSASCTCAS